MKKLIFILITLLSMSYYSRNSLADSPITSTTFYEAYLNVEIVKEAKYVKELNEKIFLYLSTESNPIDVKAAIINALGWNFDGKNNAEKYSQFKFNKSLKDLNFDALNANDLFCLGYLQALDDYFKPEKALPLLKIAQDKMKNSQTVSIVYSIVKGQLAMDTSKNWGDVWTPFEEAINDKSLKSELRPAAIKIISDYLILYKKYETTDKNSKSIESVTTVTPTQSKLSSDVLSSVMVKVSYVPVSSQIPRVEVMESLEKALTKRLATKNISNISTKIDNSNNLITVEIPWKDGYESYKAYTYFEDLIKTPALIFQEIDAYETGQALHRGDVIINDDDIIEAYPFLTESGSWAISTKLNSIGTNKLSEATGRLVGKRIGIFLGEMLISAPVVNEQIKNNVVVITLGNSNETEKSAKDFAEIINTKPLPIDIKAAKIEFENLKYKDNNVNSYKNRIELKPGNPLMIVNGEKREIDSQTAACPIILNNRTFLPIRSIIETLGGNILWNPNEKKVTINLKNKTVDLWLGQNTARVNNEVVKLDVAPQIISNRTILPIRFIAENLDCSVDWNRESRVISIFSLN